MSDLAEKFAYQPPELFEHQKKSIERYNRSPHILNFSDAGTGKTAAWIRWFEEARKGMKNNRGIVFAPLSILTAAWANDVATFAPDLRVQVVTAKDRRDTFKADADLFVTNHDMIRAIAKEPNLLPDKLGFLNVDESTAFKNPKAARAKAMYRHTRHVEHRTIMTATPRPQGIQDLFQQVLIADDGERLGQNYYRFLNSVCEPEQVGAHRQAVQWIEKTGASDAVADLLDDITIRHKLEECIDMPERVYVKMPLELSTKHRAAYDELKAFMLIETANGSRINAIHAGALRQKLLQMLSGAVYDEERLVQTFSTERYNLVADLVETRPASLVAYEWKHQMTALSTEFKKRGIKHAVIDSSVPKLADRTEIVRKFQAGELQAIIAHPRSAGHGLTLTRAVTVIWPSPTSSSELWTQFNARIYRAGQDKRTEVIMLHAVDTAEDRVYDNLTYRVSQEEDFLTLVK